VSSGVWLENRDKTLFLSATIVVRSETGMNLIRIKGEYGDKLIDRKCG
jgi:hypothetical protein